jgi:HEAT repeat protein/Na+/melibiose symporter-like transporter
MNRELTNVEKLRGLRWAWAGNSINTIFAQFTFFGSAFILFLSALGLSKTQIGFLLSLMPFAGLIALPVSPTVARFGFKRTFLTFWGIRKIVAAFLLLTPWFLSRFGLGATLTFVTVIVATFAISRAVGETGYYPWSQEFVPSAVRGKYTATSSIFTTVAGLLAVSAAGYVVGISADFSGFMFLIGAGALFGLLSVWAYSFIPGGAPVADPSADRPRWRGPLTALKDRGFTSYLAGVALITLATVPMVSFLPLFMQEQVGLKSGSVVLLQNGTLLGSLLSSYLWGWAADRYGSKPVMLSGVFIRVFLPLSWMLMPRHSSWSLYAALGIAVIQGVANMGWAIGSARLLFVSIVPSDKKSDYMALYYAWIGVIGGISQLIGGRVLDISQGLSGQFLIFSLDPYFPLFLIGLVLPFVSWLVFRGAPADSGVTIGEFAGIFLRGNPFQAMGSLIRYYRARDEQAAVEMTERLSRARSRLTVDELLEALADPRFHVRFEAIVSIARMRPDPRLTGALIQLLGGSELALSVVAAWALGRIGDDAAVEPLRQALDSRYHSIQAHSARALGALGAKECIPLLLERLPVEPDKGLQMAYASALGQLGAEQATGTLLALLRDTENKGARLELALALARTIGDDRYFVNLLRQVRQDAGTATSQAVSSLKRTWHRLHIDDDELTRYVAESAEALGRGDLKRGADLLSTLITMLPMERVAAPGREILEECAQRLDELGAARIEYVILTLYAMQEGWQV